jgi:hypothetical protein
MTGSRPSILTSYRPQTCDHRPVTRPISTLFCDPSSSSIPLFPPPSVPPPLSLLPSLPPPGSLTHRERNQTAERKPSTTSASSSSRCRPSAVVSGAEQDCMACQSMRSASTPKSTTRWLPLLPKVEGLLRWRTVESQRRQAHGAAAWSWGGLASVSMQVLRSFARKTRP